MGTQSLEEKLQSVDSPARMLQEIDVDAVEFPHVPDEVTHWIEEQRSWQETCCLADQSHHMTELHVEGPDALELFSDLGVNDFTGFEPKQAKQLVVTSPEGYMIGDGILFCLDDDVFNLVGYGPINWVHYNLETGDYDADLIERMGHDSAFTETHFFRAGEFERVLEAAGLAVEWLVGLEGLASVYTADPLRETADGLDEDERVGVRSLIDHLRDDRTVADVSAHILAVCRSG